MAPEIVKSGDAEHDLVSFSFLGVLTIELLTGASPFTVNVKNQPLIPNYISKIAKDFILKLLMNNLKCRLGSKGLEDVKHHPFFGSDIDLDTIARK
ncbi:unnamed protein product, partial [Rotaria sp. Silwood1]